MNRFCVFIITVSHLLIFLLKKFLLVHRHIIFVKNTFKYKENWRKYTTTPVCLQNIAEIVWEIDLQHFPKDRLTRVNVFQRCCDNIFWMFMMSTITTRLKMFVYVIMGPCDHTTQNLNCNKKYNKIPKPRHINLKKNIFLCLYIGFDFSRNIVSPYISQRRQNK